MDRCEERAGDQSRGPRGEAAATLKMGQLEPRRTPLG